MIYVDKEKNKYGRMIMSHLWTDQELDTLTEFGKLIGLKPEWIHHSKIFPHFDVCQSKRKEAIEHGAIEVDLKEFMTLKQVYERLISKLKNKIDLEITDDL